MTRRKNSRGESQRYMDYVERIESARSLHELADVAERSLHVKSGTCFRALADRIVRRSRELGHNYRCRRGDTHEECMVQFLEHVDSIQMDLFRNPTQVFDVDGLRVTVFEDFDLDDNIIGYWAQAYDDEGPIGARWYGATPEDALESAESRVPSKSGRWERGTPSPGDSQARVLRQKKEKQRQAWKKQKMLKPAWVTWVRKPSFSKAELLQLGEEDTQASDRKRKNPGLSLKRRLMR